MFSDPGTSALRIGLPNKILEHLMKKDSHLFNCPSFLKGGSEREEREIFLLVCTDLLPNACNNLELGWAEVRNQEFHLCLYMSSKDSAGMQSSSVYQGVCCKLELGAQLGHEPTHSRV